MCVYVYLALNILGDCIPYNIAFICVTISYFMSHYTNMHYWWTLQGWSVIGYGVYIVFGYGVYIVFVACAAFVLILQAVGPPQFLCLIPMVTYFPVAHTNVYQYLHILCTGMCFSEEKITSTDQTSYFGLAVV